MYCPVLSCIARHAYLWKFHILALNAHIHTESVLKRCISELPKSECPYIPKSYLQQYRSRVPRSISDDDAQNHMLAKRSFQFPDGSALSQTVANEPIAQCEERRELGSQILMVKGQNVDLMLARFVSNFIMMFSNQTSSQEVSEFQEHHIIIRWFAYCVWMGNRKKRAL